MRRELAELEVADGVSTCVFGSWARDELTEESDYDWAVLVDHEFDAYEPAVAREMLAAIPHLGEDKRRPGKQGVFGVPIAVPELSTKIGLDADTNTNLTRRMLLLLESRELHGQARAIAISQILDRYLNEGVKDFRPPRFLLNDIVRYWRTICIDFEGKSSGGGDRKWGTRNAKLRTSRKLLFTGGLIPVLLCRLIERDRMQDFLIRWFNATPLDRLATAFLFVDLAEVGVRALGAYDRWIGLMSDKDVRAELRDVRYDTRDDSPAFAEIRELGRGRATRTARAACRPARASAAKALRQHRGQPFEHNAARVRVARGIGSNRGHACFVQPSETDDRVLDPRPHIALLDELELDPREPAHAPLIDLAG